MTKKSRILIGTAALALILVGALCFIPVSVFCTTTTPVLYGVSVPSANDTANSTMANVVGSKLDATASGAVDTTTSIMGYIKQLVAGQIVNDGNIDAILVDTATTIPATIATAQADLDTITGASGVNLLTATQASIDAIETDTSTTIPATIATAQADLNIITGATGVNLLTATQASIDAIETDTSTTIPGTIATAQADLDIITGANGVNLLTATQASIDAIETDTGITLPATLLAMPQCVVKTAGAVLANTTDDLFIISGGPVRCKIVGVVTTIIGGASNMKLQITTDAPAATVELNAGAVAIDNDAAGTIYQNIGATSTFTPGDTLGAEITDPVTVEETEFILTPGTVKAHSSAAQTGVITWYMTFTPMSPTSTVAAAS